MKYYYYDKKYEGSLDQVTEMSQLTEDACALIGKAADQIVLCTEGNKRITDENISELTKDFRIVVYDQGRVLDYGMNEEGMCTNPKCSFYNRSVVKGLGFPSSVRIRHECVFNCPYCDREVEVSRVIMKNCHFRFYTISGCVTPTETNLIHASLLEPVFYDISSLSNTEEYDFNVQAEDVYVCDVCHKYITEDLDSEHVRKHSVCDLHSKCIVCKETGKHSYFSKFTL